MLYCKTHFHFLSKILQKLNPLKIEICFLFLVADINIVQFVDMFKFKMFIRPKAKIFLSLYDGGKLFATIAMISLLQLFSY